MKYQTTEFGYEYHKTCGLFSALGAAMAKPVPRGFDKAWEGGAIEPL